MSKRIHYRDRLVMPVLLFSLSSTLHAQHEIEEIRVVATPLEQSVAEIAQSVTVIGGEDLQRVQSTNLGETLAGQLGMSASSFGAGASRPIIRGLAGARIKIMEDGIDSLDVSTVSIDHAVSVDPLVAEQIEIFRGPTTLLYGSGAVGGVVNTVTNRIPEGAPADGFDAGFELRGDTVADDRTGALRLDGGGDAFAWHIDALRREASDYDIPGEAELHPGEEEEARAFGVLENSAVETSSASLGGTWLGDDAFLGVSVSGFETLYGIPGPHHHEEQPLPEVGVEQENVRVDVDQRRFDVKGGWTNPTGALDAINLRIGVNDYAHQEIEGAELGTLFENHAYEGRLEFVHAPWGDWDGAFGVQFGEREFSATGEEAFIPPVDTTTLGFFMLEERSFADWTLSIGGRLESQEHRPSDGSPAIRDTAASISLAAIRRLADDYALALHFAVAERLPVAEELYANGPHLASRTFEIGNTALGTETSRHMDIGIRRSAGILTWSVTAFYTSFADFIFLRETGDDDSASGLPIFEYSQSDAEIAGLEAELFAPIAQIGAGELDLRLFADMVEGELDSGENLPRLPPLRIGARLQYHDDRLILGFESAWYDD
ncbi:MAG TPA: TonB-dependent receptor, partial [Gammaproteobacteria bacterium]|nr:TonB-dependent receptor [Gammaproteobacteria bacterium]